MSEHTYEVTVSWTGNRGPGTTGIRDYDRDHTVAADGPPVIEGTADPGFLGDPTRWNPEQLFTASISQCHMLWYLGLCARAGVVVHEYSDEAEGTMVSGPDHRARFSEVVLRPRVVVDTAEQVERAVALHEKAHEMCFIAQSVNFEVKVDPLVTVR
ncbi:MAG TPA: OsmC family protein [Nocardioidaceae bacterium]|nr:OsmC family protein [Nocardioidaceae bacterium]